MTNLRSLLLASFLFSLVTACGGGGGGTTDSGTGGGNDAGGGDPSALIGSWFQQVTPVTSDDQTETLTFASGGIVTFVHTQVDAATGTMAGCTETCTTPGTYTATATQVTTTADTSASTNVLSDCTDPTQNGPSAATSCQSFATTFGWTVVADTLTLSDPSSPTSTLVFMRR